MTKATLVLTAMLLASCAGNGDKPDIYNSGDVTLALSGRLFDGSGNEAQTQRHVLIANERIVCVGSAKRCPIPAGVRHIVVEDATIMPGLIDLHVHSRAHFISWFLTAGVTTIRDANNSLEHIETLLAVEHRPRVFWTGPLLDGPNTIMRHFGADGVMKPGSDNLSSAWTLEVATPTEAQQAVRWLAARGATFVKLYEQLDPVVYAAATAEAKTQNMRIMTDLGMHNTRGLTGATVDALQAIAAGVDTIEHASGYALAYQRLGGDASQLPFDDALIEYLARATVQAGVAVVPTLAVSYSFADDVADIDDLPAVGQLRANSEMLSWYQQTAQRSTAHAGKSHLSHQLAARIVQRVHELGGIIGAGSDAPAGVWNLPGGGIHRELELLVRHGLTPTQALHAATGAAASILGQTDLGQITEGALADILVVAGNPNENIKQTRQIQWLIKNGIVLTEPSRTTQNQEEYRK